jgi:uncharacterized circularly permuted ATP-grasp superfamily protein
VRNNHRCGKSLTTTQPIVKAHWVLKEATLRVSQAVINFQTICQCNTGSGIPKYANLRYFFLRRKSRNSL